ncbi:ANPRA protein, partial [Sclerurus mexicanus]|nr:ANPRA protein [Sclerurus mexicanus]
LTLAVVLPERNLTYPWAWPRVGPAVRLAAAAVNSRRDLLPGLALRWVFGSSEDRHGVCSEMAAPLAAVDLRLAHHPAAFVGPGCVFTRVFVTVHGCSWPYMGVQSSTRAPRRCSWPYMAVPDATRVFMAARGCARVFTGVHSSTRVLRAIHGCSWPYMGVHGCTRVFMAVHGRVCRGVPALSPGGSRAAGRGCQGRVPPVVYVCCAPDTLRELLLQAEREGLTGGDFAFFYIDIFGASLQGGRFPDPHRPWHRGDRHDPRARRAFQAVTIITYTEPQNPEYRPFLQRLRQEAREHFNFSMKDGLVGPRAPP